MKKAACLLLLPLFLLGSLPLQTEAQFVRLTMEIESELKAFTVRPLSFGTVRQNTGEISITMDEENAGIFAIAGHPAQFVLVTLEAPDTLYHADRSIPDRIPLTIRAAYANRGAERVEDARFFPGNSALFRMFENAATSSPESSMPEVTAYIYIFGSIRVDDIETGVYDGDVILQVEYL